MMPSFVVDVVVDAYCGIVGRAFLCADFSRSFVGHFSFSIFIGSVPARARKVVRQDPYLKDNVTLCINGVWTLPL